MAPSKRFPMAEYVVKLMLLETIHCYANQDADEIRWLETQMFKMLSRWKELSRGGK